MFRYFLKLAIKNFQYNRLLFAGSIITASLGTFCISLLFSYVYNELSMDDFHKRKKDIYIMVIQASPESQWEAIDAASFFKFNYKDFSEIENLTALWKFREGEIKISYNETTFTPEVLIADSTFFEIFDFKLIIGDDNFILSDPNAAIITEQFAQKVFGSINPIGQLLKVEAESKKVYTVKGIIENPPSNSSMTFDLILPSYGADLGRVGADFLLANRIFNKDSFVKKIDKLGRKHPQFTQSKMNIIALDDVYFSKGSPNSYGKLFTRFGNITSIYVFCIIMILILMIASLNFASLQVININSNIKSLNVNKVNGANGRQILFQKSIEFILLIIFSALIVTVAYVVVLPYLNTLTKVALSTALWKVLLLNGAILSILSALAMIFPGILIFRIITMNNFKNQVFTGSNLVGQKVVVTLQFTISIALLIVSMLVVRQLSMMIKKDLGFSYQNTISVKMFQRLPGSENRDEFIKRLDNQQKNYQFVKSELDSNPSVSSYSQGLSPLEPFIMPWKLRDSKSDYTSQNVLVVTPGYLGLLGLELTDGRFFNSQIDKSRQDKVVINEAAKKYWGIEDIKKYRILNSYWNSQTGFEIIGVVKDFNYEHVSVKPLPLVMVYYDDVDLDFLIKIDKNAIQAGLQFVQQLHNQTNPGVPFVYTFLSDKIANLYQNEKRLSIIYILFTLIALLISVIGLFIISLYDTQMRTKEIGIRKINGAKVSEVIMMLNKDFVKWVAVAFVIACPIAWYAMHRWLENFAYKTELSWWIFALAGLLALGIALLTVSWQSWKAATRNPVEALRYE
jgi:putative ABC transport system permease protein